MAMTKEKNDFLTQTGAGTPMGLLLRQYWVPAIRSNALEADGAPVKVRLFAQDFVAFRATDGRVGLVDEACPHRGVSLALGRNEENGLRCIFHGWKVDVAGAVVDAPCEPAARREKFCSSIRTSRYSVKESCGVVWVYVGTGEAPAFPNFEFHGLPDANVCIRRAVVRYNWLQGVEAHIDSSHVPILHRGFLVSRSGANLDASFRENLSQMMNDMVPRFEVNETAYGLQESALRDAGNGRTYARIREVVLPFYTFIPGPDEGPWAGRISVPIDDETSAEWYVVYHPHKPLSDIDIDTVFHNTSDDPDDFAANMGTADNLWNQDRGAMINGHWSGFPQNLPFEDFIAQASMGPRYDRSKEQLGTADAIIVRVRRMLTEAVENFQDGHAIPWVEGFDYAQIRAKSATYGEENNWREFASSAEQPRAEQNLL